MEDKMFNFFEEGYRVLHNLRKDRILCDVSLRGNTNNQIFHAHRVILASRSTYFHAMFTSDMIESEKHEIVIEGVETYALGKIIEYCYTGVISTVPNDVEDILEAAHMLGLYHVQKICFDFLKNNIDSTNCYGIAYLAEKYSCCEMKKVAEEYALKNFRFVMNSSDFQELNYENLLYLISHKDLNVLCEGDVFDAVLKWVKYKTEERKKYLKGVLAHVRFPMLTRKFLIDKVTKEELIITDSGCREYLYSALDYHLVPERRSLTDLAQYSARVNITSAMYVIGGENRTGPLNSVEMFDFRNQSWQECASLTTSRKHSAVVMLGGMIYCVGGIDSSFRDLMCVEKYDPSLNQWTYASSLKTCKGVLAVAVLDGWLYAAGGSNGGSSIKSIERYDPILDKWTQVQHMKYPRSHFGIAVLNNKLYAVGGYSGISDVEHCEAFDPLTNKWKDLADLNKSRMDHGVVVHSEKLFAIGGYSNCGILDCIEKYNRGLNMWLIIKHTLDPRTGASVSLVTSGSDEHFLFIVGGIDGSHCYHSSVKRVNLKSADYSIGSGKSMNEPRAYGCAVAL